MIETKLLALAKNKSGKKSDQGNRGALTSGKHLDKIIEIIIGEVDEVFGTGEFDFIKKDCNLPGYFRPFKNWDLLIRKDGCLIAALELKSIFSSYGNNANNRTEEVVGTGFDFHRMFQELNQEVPLSGVGKVKMPVFNKVIEKPFLGFIMIMLKTVASEKIVMNERRNSGLRNVDKDFESVSYIERFKVMCERLRRAELYKGAALIVITSDEGDSEIYAFEELMIDLFAHLESVRNKLNII